jgi:hypothetical protein
MPKTPEEIAAEEKAASDAQREQLAREANKKRNDAMLEARNAIADNADDIKADEDDLVPLTDEEWDQNDRPEDAKRKTRAERLAEQEAEEEGELTEDEAAARLIRAKEQEDRELDEVRDAGADDSRERDDGTREYRLVVNGKVKWLTLQQLRETAGKVEAADEYLQEAKEGATNGSTRRTSPTDAEREQARREAEERRTEERATLRAKLVDLNTRASMGDEAAINELADMQLEAIQGDSGRLMRMVDERVDSRIVGRSDFQKAVDWFESDDGYADVLTTPRLKAEAGRLDAALAQAEPNLTPRQRLDRVGKQMRQLRQDFGGPVTRRETPRTESKLERKRNAPQIPQAAGRQRPDAEPDEQESTQDAIRKMAQSRGQARAISHKH